MSTFQITEQILAPPLEVFDFLTDLKSGKLIEPNIRETELVGSDMLNVGSIVRQSKGLPGKEKQRDYEITAIESPLNFHIQSKLEGITADYRYDLVRIRKRHRNHFISGNIGGGAAKITGLDHRAGYETQRPQSA